MFFGKWITANQQWDNLHILFSKQFVTGDFSHAKIRITADDYYKLYINGKFVGQGPAPSYSFNYRYNEFDITDYICTGENEITVLVYYQGLTNRVWVSGDNVFGMIADITVDGKIICASDSTWKYSIDNTFADSKAVGYDTAFLENRDMTLPPSPPENAVETECPHTFADEPFPALCVYEKKATPTVKNGRYFYDFGREYVCHPVIIANAKIDGAKLIIRCSEELNSDGTPRFEMRCGCRYEEICTLKMGENIIEQYDYKALRYMEISADENTTITAAKILVRHYPFDEKTQQFNTKNERLKRVLELCKSTVHYGVQETLVDCPTREKGQYLGDAYIIGFAHYYLTHDSRMLKKSLYDFADSVRFSGRFLSVAPCAYEQKIADYDLLYPHMLLKYYRLTNDKKTLAALAPICRHILGEYACFENSDGLLENVTNAWNLVDWPDNMRDGYEYNNEDEGERGLHSVINAYYVFANACYEIICGILGEPRNAKSHEIKQAFNKTFFNEQTGLYVDCRGSTHSSVHANILPLAFDICEKTKTVTDYLIKKGMRCSVYMSYFYLTALCKAGNTDAAKAAITSDGEHSWLNMLREGATSTFEAWGKEQKWNTSLFHPWAVAPILIINEYNI